MASIYTASIVNVCILALLTYSTAFDIYIYPGLCLRHTPGPGLLSLSPSPPPPCASSKNMTGGMPPRDAQERPANEDVQACHAS